MSPSALWGMGIIRCCITAMTQACAQHMVRAGRVNTQVHWGFRWPWGLFSIPPPPWSCGDTWGHPSSQKPQRSYARNNLVIQSGNVFWIKAREGNAFLDLIKSQLFFFHVSLGVPIRWKHSWRCSDPFLMLRWPDFKNFPDFNESTRKSGNARPPRSFVTHF